MFVKIHPYCKELKLLIRIIGAFIKKKSSAQTPSKGTTTCRSYKYLFRAGIKHVTRSAAVRLSEMFTSLLS